MVLNLVNYMGIEGFKGNPERIEKERISQESFERQFQEEHSIEVEGEVIPFTTVVPEEPTSEDWVVYVGGFSQGKDSYLSEIQNLAQAGRKVLFVNPLKGVEMTKDEIQTDTLSAVPKSILSKAKAVQEVLSSVGAQNIDIVGHSQGAAVATVFSAAYPNVANKIILECPAGLLEGDDSRLKIITRFVADKASLIVSNPKKLFSEEGIRGSKSFSKEIIDEPMYRYNEEIPGVAEVDIAPLLKQIKKEDKNAEVILLNANKDKVYSPERIEKTLGGNPLEEYIDRWAMYESKKASHIASVVERPGLLRQILE